MRFLRRQGALREEGAGSIQTQEGQHLDSEEGWFLSGERLKQRCLEEVCRDDGIKTGHLHLVASIFSVQWDAQSSAEGEEKEWASRTEERCYLN